MLAQNEVYDFQRYTTVVTLLHRRLLPGVLPVLLHFFPFILQQTPSRESSEIFKHHSILTRFTSPRFSRACFSESKLSVIFNSFKGNTETQVHLLDFPPYTSTFWLFPSTIISFESALRKISHLKSTLPLGLNNLYIQRKNQAKVFIFNLNTLSNPPFSIRCRSRISLHFYEVIFRHIQVFCYGGYSRE